MNEGRQADADPWRELAVETIRNLGSLVEQAESLLRRARERLDELDAERND
jgi:hypothetical protein